MSFTLKRTQEFCKNILEGNALDIGIVDVGSGGRALDIFSIEGIPYSAQEMEKMKADILNIYKYSRVDAGVDILYKLAKGVVGLKK